MFEKGGGFVLSVSRCLIHISTDTAKRIGSDSMQDGSFCECWVWGGRVYFIALCDFFLCNRIKLKIVLSLFLLPRHLTLTVKLTETSGLAWDLLSFLCLGCSRAALLRGLCCLSVMCCVLHCFAFEGLSSLYGKEGHLHLRARRLV